MHYAMFIINIYLVCDQVESQNVILFVLGPVKAVCFRSCQGLKL